MEHCEVLSDEPLPSAIERNTLESLMAGEDGPREIAFLDKQRCTGLYLYVLQVQRTGYGLCTPQTFRARILLMRHALPQGLR